MNIKLVQLTYENKLLLEEMMEEWLSFLKESGIDHESPWAIFKNDYHNFDKYIKEINDKGTEPGKVPSTTYFALDLDRNIFVGAVNIRHYLNAGLYVTGGHIGDGVRPSERRKGVATEMIRQALIICKDELEIKHVLITCNKDNMGSAKSIINNGGILENEVEEDGKILQRYWIHF